MALLKASELVSECKKMRDSSFGYVLGGQGELYNLELAQKWGERKRSGKPYSYFVYDCAHWFGHYIVDCSGMIIEALRTKNPSYKDQTANNLFNGCKTRGYDMKSIPEVPGLCVWKSGHIGIYIGKGKVIEAKGYRYGVVETALSSTAWTGWGYLKDVDYSNGASSTGSSTSTSTSGSSTSNGSTASTTPKPSTQDAVIVLRRVLKYQSPMITGEDVRAVQQVLSDNGFTLGTVDGKFGTRTKSAVTLFQRKNNLTPTGEVGEKEIVAMGGKWEGTSTSTTAIFTVSRVLKYIESQPYMVGDDVKAVQTTLKSKGFTSVGSIDGKYGAKTRAAVMAFQQKAFPTDKGEWDGKVGKKTTAALGGKWTGN